MTNTIIATLILFYSSISLASFSSLSFDRKVSDNIQRLHKLAQKPGATILWWNVAWGQFNSDSSLGKNLIALINSSLSPDIIAMAEFKFDILGPEATAMLSKVYPHSSFVAMYPGSEVGVMFYSKHPFHQSPEYPLDWTPLSSSYQEAALYKTTWLSIDREWVKHWDRTFSHYKVFFPNGYLLNIAPVHLCSPWMSYKKQFGNWETLLTVMNADENPLLHQQTRLTQFLKRDLGQHYGNEPFILIGDFNVPSKIGIPLIGGTPKMHKLLKEGLQETIDPSRDTYPTKSSIKDKKGFFRGYRVQLDKAFSNKGLSQSHGDAFHFKGSDHYPILMKVY
jgi:hypothetical protein